MGVLTDHCLRSHGWSSWDKHDRTIHDCNQGRGSLLYAFRRHLFRTAGIAPSPPPPRHLVALFAGGHRAWGRWPGIRDAVTAKAAELPGAGVDLWMADLALMTAREQMDKVGAATTAVAAMGGNAISLLFLRRGAGAVLLTDQKDWLDWDLWAHAAWLRSSWLPVDAAPELVAEEALQQLRRYDSFRDTPAPGGSGVGRFAVLPEPSRGAVSRSRARLRAAVAAAAAARATECGRCAPRGCPALCRSAGYGGGSCKEPQSTNPGNCCHCV